LGTHFMAWARMVARLEVLAARRRRGKRESNLGRELSAETVEVLAEACPPGWGSEARMKALSECLGQLAPKARELVRLRYFEEWGPSQIASELSRTVNSVDVSLSKTREKLRECMRHRMDRIAAYE
jgi:RNA polymerase sigma factor (sigma-70 family)